MIPKELFRSLVDLSATFTISLLDEYNRAELTVRPAAHGKLTINDEQHEITDIVSVVLPLINAYFVDDVTDRGLSTNVGSLDVGKSCHLQIRCKRLAKPIQIDFVLLGNSTTEHHDDGAYIHVAITDRKPALYHVIAIETGLHELEVFSLRALPRDVLQALAVGGTCAPHFDPEKLFKAEYGEKALNNALAIADADEAAFIARLAAAKDELFG